MSKLVLIFKWIYVLEFTRPQTHSHHPIRPYSGNTPTSKSLTFFSPNLGSASILSLNYCSELASWTPCLLSLHRSCTWLKTKWDSMKTKEKMKREKNFLDLLPLGKADFMWSTWILNAGLKISFRWGKNPKHCFMVYLSFLTKFCPGRDTLSSLRKLQTGHGGGSVS